MKLLKLIGIAVILGALVNVAIGGVFIAQSISVNAEVKQGLADEGLTTQLPKEGEPGYIEGNVVDTAAEATAVAEYILSHMHGENGTDRYSNLPRGSEERASYLDGFALVTGLNLAVMGFGVTQIALAIGIVMIVTGLVLGLVGFVLYRYQNLKA